MINFIILSFAIDFSPTNRIYLCAQIDTKLAVPTIVVRHRTPTESNYENQEVEELIAILRETDNLEEQGDILQYLVDTQGLEYNTGMIKVLLVSFYWIYCWIKILNYYQNNKFSQHFKVFFYPKSCVCQFFRYLRTTKNYWVNLNIHNACNVFRLNSFFHLTFPFKSGFCETLSFKIIKVINYYFFKKW